MNDYVPDEVVAPDDDNELREGIRRAVSLAGQRFEDPRDWADSVAALLSAAGTGTQFTGAPVPAR